MPSLTTWAAFYPCGQCYPRDQNKHTAAPVKVARQQTTREPSGTFATLPPTGRNLPPILPPEPTPTHAGTLRLRNLPRPSAPTYASIHRNPPKSSGAGPQNRTYTILHRNSPEPSGTCLQNLHQHTPELSGTFRNLPPEPTPAYAGTFRNLPELASRRNSPEPSGTRLRNLHQHTPELSGTFRNPLRNLQQHTTEPSGTFRNLPPEPAPATRTGTHRSLSGLKTPLAYAVGEQSEAHPAISLHHRCKKKRFSEF